MKGRKCSIIFMRKVANRLEVLEERYKDLPHQERAKKINEEMMETFCVGEREIKRWKTIVKVATKGDHMVILPPSHYREIARLPEEIQEEVIQKVQNENLTVKQTSLMVNSILNEEKEPDPIPEGFFKVVYADPPWNYDVDFLSASPNSHYSVMSTDEICAEKVSSAEDAILFLWATNPLLKDALRVMEAWGFKYKTNIVWVKDKIGLGFYVRGQHELLLIGTKGKMSPPEESRRVSSVLISPSSGHSVKPEAVYDLIEGMYPESKFLELFARNKREGWTAWGKQVT
jgi:N6-adenosine-specific RNA methylase IME4